MKHRFFLPPASISQGQVIFPPDLAHQLHDVLRMHPGARVTVLDNAGQEYEVELEQVQRDRATGHVRAQWAVQAEPGTSITLYPCLLKGERMEWVLQKGTELGVCAFVPLLSERTVARDAGRMANKRPRWERIIREAAEQSHRGRLPALHAPLFFAQACQESAQAHDLSLIPWEEETRDDLAGVLRARDRRPAHIGLFIGPEGGFAADEIALARRWGMQVVTLGPRILRAETAALAAVAIILSEMGEMSKAAGSRGSILP
jgi:16S rRNA (uracil1498-N3)-methyltransferase